MAKKKVSEITYREVVSFDEFRNDMHHQEGQEEQKYFKININNILEDIECIKHWISKINHIIIFCKNEKNEYILLISNNDSNSIEFRCIDRADTLDKLYNSANLVLGENILPESEKDVTDVVAKLKELVEN